MQTADIAKLSLAERLAAMGRAMRGAARIDAAERAAEVVEAVARG